MVETWKFNWNLFSLYADMKEIVKMTVAVFTLSFVFALVFEAYFLLITVPIWILTMGTSLITLWSKVIKPTHEKVIKEIELEKKYDFIFNRFNDRER